jgi:uncharacterized Zn-finger protein
MFNQDEEFGSNTGDTRVQDIAMLSHTRGFPTKTGCVGGERPGVKKHQKVEAHNRPFICHYRSCNRAFKRFEHLKRHYRIHTGERPFKCKYPGCHKAFARSDNLNQHLKVHSGGSSISLGHKELDHVKYLDDEY